MLTDHQIDSRSSITEASAHLADDGIRREDAHQSQTIALAEKQSLSVAGFPLLIHLFLF